MSTPRIVDAQMGAFRGSLAAAMGKGGPLPPAVPVAWWRSVLYGVWVVLSTLFEVAMFVLFVVLVVFVGLALVVGGAYAARFGWNLAG